MPSFLRSQALKPIGLILFSVLVAQNAASAQHGWAVARNSRFEVYSEAGAADARAALARFEQLRAFFVQQGFAGAPNATARLRVVGFASEASYAAFRLRAAADAFYASLGNQNFIVLPGLEPRRFPMAAHEYAHVVLHGSGVRLPLWLSEGLAEYFSTLRMTDRGTEVGGDLPARSATLFRNGWISLPQLLSANQGWLAQQPQKQDGMFYAESWALTNLLISNDSYSARFPELIRMLDSGVNSADALTRVYGVPLATLETAMHANRTEASRLPSVSIPEDLLEVADASDYEVGFLLADLLAAEGEMQRSADRYRDLLRVRPGDANLHAALGNLALRQGKKAEAVGEWRIAIQNGVRSADLCYQYSQLASEQEVPENEIRKALERAIELSPEFDDARYSLAMHESNAGEFEAALDQLHAMHSPAPERAFNYWSAVAYAATELDRRDEAEQAAARSLEYATTPAERTRALEAAYIAKTDLTVQFARDKNGAVRLITTRVPHGTSDHNPFIEPQDEIRRVSGKLNEVKCDAGRLAGFVVFTAQGALSLVVPDPTRVMIRNSAGEFNCGVQGGQPVQAEYAAQGNVLRGMTFQ
jgi:tetratricopeptide (TPR) repeat protein